MKKSGLKFILLLVLTTVAAQHSAFCQSASKDARFRNTYYDVRRAAHDMEGLPKGSVVFVGNSITEQGWWSTLFKSKNVENRGIGGDNTYGILDRLPSILESEPQKLFLMAGINDISLNTPLDTIVFNLRQMVKLTARMAPECKLYVQSVLPINDNRLAYPKVKGANPVIRELNGKIKKMCEEEGVRFLDIASLLSDENGDLKLSLTKDGLHIHPQAYIIWAGYLKKSGLLR